jgi:hypothetical protein
MAIWNPCSAPLHGSYAVFQLSRHRPGGVKDEKFSSQLSLLPFRQIVNGCATDFVAFMGYIARLFPVASGG